MEATHIEVPKALYVRRSKFNDKLGNHCPTAAG